MIRIQEIKTSAQLMGIITQLGFSPDAYAPRTSIFHMDKPICVIDNRKNRILDGRQVLVYVLPDKEELHIERVDWYEQDFVPYAHWHREIDEAELRQVIIRAGSKNAWEKTAAI